ncbi:MAG: hypothetical protein HZB51_20575 [Chloroflexi bacterium]|nr:hypothetical protein [Chloroflexota bacterium]
MTATQNLIRNIAAGDTLKPWIMLGAFNHDVSDKVIGLSYFEDSTSQVGRAAMNEILTEAHPILASSPTEGCATTFHGETAQWNLVRGPEKYLSWGTYNIKNHLGAAFLSSVITPTQAGMRQWRLIVNNIRALVSINGKIVFDSATSSPTSLGVAFEHHFQAELQPGDNIVNLGLFRIARMAQVGFRLDLVDSDATVRAPLAPEMPLDTRALVEEELNGLRLPRDIIYPGHNLGLKLENASASSNLQSGFKLQVELVNSNAQVVQTVQPTTAGEVVLAAGNALTDGVYHIYCKWLDREGSVFTSTSFKNIRRITPIVAPQGYDKIDERRRLALEHYADNAEPDMHRIWEQVARYALGQYTRVDESTIRWTCEFIAARNDCADFVIQGILRLMFWERQQQHLSPEINGLMKDTVLGFKYWIDEPGDTVMYMGSENHRLLFHVAEWMAGFLFPTEMFTNSQQNGLFHYHKAFTYITEWLRQRGRFGFDEWHSNSYFPICIAPLLNVFDFALIEGQYKLRQMVGAVLDEMFFNLGSDSYQGIWGTTHGRSYGIYIKHPDFEGTSALCWLLFGNGSLTKGTSGMAPVCLGTSTYKPPKIIFDMATDHTNVVEAKERQGILRTSMRHADFVVYRTPDYMLSGLQDHRKGEFESSTHTHQITLGNKANIFWSAPHTTGEGSGLRPDYWSGSSVMPRVIQYKNVMSLTFRLNDFTWMSHAWFPQELFDQVRFAGNWVFVCVKQGYVGIYSQNGIKVGREGQYAGRELQCWAHENTWLVECGREADWKSFDAFVGALSAARITLQGSVITFESPSSGCFVTGWDVVPTIDNVPIQLNRYPLVDSAWAHSKFGSGEIALTYGDQVYELWLNQ